MSEPTNIAVGGHRCSQCGAELPAHLPTGACPKCLLKTGLATQPHPGPTGTVVVSAERPSSGLPQPGEEIGHYRIVRSLGGGGMGTVFEAEDLESGRHIALKVLNQALDSPEARRRFFREGRLAASINHPNSVYVFGTEEFGGIPLITMELVAGGTLEDRVRAHGPMPPSEAVDAVLQITAGLEAAQGFGIVHRDVKPSNCFVDADGCVKIGDFGLSVSTVIRTESALTVAGSFLGTPAFSSPEQLRGEELNARSDIYSVGATLFYLLTGRAPFEAKNTVALIATVLEQPAPSPRQIRPSLPRGLSKAVRRCLDKQAGERFKSYEELRKALAPYGSTAPVPATLGLRCAAGALDMLCFSLGGMALATLVIMADKFHPFGLFQGADTDTAFSSEAPGIFCIVFYFALLEGLWGASLGKFICGLRVVGADNNPPGFWRALTRALLCALAPALPQWLYCGIDPKPYVESQSLWGLAFYVWVALLFCTARRKNGFAAFHDLVTKTRVISKNTLQASAAPFASDPSPPSVEAKPLIGPYHVLDTLEESPEGSWLLGYDLRLLRKVWIRKVPGGTSPIAVALRNLGRAGRLRWLAGRRSPEENWDAYEAPSGQPLLRMVQDGSGQDASRTSNSQPWAGVRFWLCDLAAELSAAQKDGTLPTTLSLDRVWITGGGRAKLLDFPAPGSPAQPAENANAARFLSQVAAAALEGNAGAAAKPASEVSVPLPLHARQFFQSLPQFSDMDALLLALRPLLQRVAVVTRRRRAAMVAACVAFPLFCCCSSFFTKVYLAQSQREIPGIFELSQILQKRALMQRWFKDQPRPTDLQYAIYIASHYRAAITNEDSWSSVLALSLVKGEDRRFAEQSVAHYPAPTDKETAEADAALKESLPKPNPITELGQPSAFLILMLAGLALFAALPALIAALAFRGGLVLLLTGVTFVRRDGTLASRRLLFNRAVAAWSPLLLAFVLSGVSLAIKNPGLTVLGFGLLVILAAISVALPQRGLADRLAGTWPVPR